MVAIAVSTGGPTALGDVLSHLPANFPAPILLVQHMPQMFTRFLAERLNGQTPLTVKEAADGEPVQPGVVYVAPGDFHLTVKRRQAASSPCSIRSRRSIRIARPPTCCSSRSRRRTGRAPWVSC